jgi:hypothetical protein
MGSVLALTLISRGSIKYLIETNTLAYLVRGGVTLKKSFMTLPPVMFDH